MASKIPQKKKTNPMSKYTGTSDGVATAKRPGTERFVILCNKRWQFKNLGTWVVRDIKGKPGSLSVHATARALDTSYGANKAAGKEAILWFVQHAAALGLEEVHDYSGITKKGCETWGRGWRIGRGWKDWSADDNGGSQKATWIHVELAPKYADMSAGDYEAVWRSVPKP
jgi:hypothetical protein